MFSRHFIIWNKVKIVLITGILFSMLLSSVAFWVLPEMLDWFILPARAETINLASSPTLTLAFGTTALTSYCVQWTPTVDAAAFSLTTSIRKDGAPTGNITAYLEADNGSNVPLHTHLASSVIAASSLSDSYADRTFATTTYSLIAGTKYWTCLEAGMADNDVNYPVDRGSDCSGLGLLGYSFDGVTWSSSSNCISKTILTDEGGEAPPEEAVTGEALEIARAGFLAQNVMVFLLSMLVFVVVWKR